MADNPSTISDDRGHLELSHEHHPSESLRPGPAPRPASARPRRAIICAVASASAGETDDRGIGRTRSRPEPESTSPADSRRDAAADQAVAELLPAAVEPALDRPQRPAELPRGLVERALLQVAEHDRGAVALGQPPQLGVDRGREVEVGARPVGMPHRAGARTIGVRGSGAGPRPSGATTRPDGPRRAARGRPTRAYGSSRPGGAGPGTSPGTRRRPRAGRPARPGRRAAPSARAARSARRRPPRPRRSLAAGAGPAREPLQQLAVGQAGQASPRGRSSPGRAARVRSDGWSRRAFRYPVSFRPDSYSVTRGREVPTFRPIGPISPDRVRTGGTHVRRAFRPDFVAAVIRPRRSDRQLAARWRAG